MRINRHSYTDSYSFFGEASPYDLVKEFGSPLYVYNENILRARCREMRSLVALPNFFVSYSSKANSNPHLLRIVREEGLMADAMSPGEMAMLHHAGFTKNSIMYVCNNISEEELAFAAKNAAIASVDSVSQLESFGRVNPGASVMIRLNPGIGAGHHAKVITAGKETKFGVSPDDFDAMFSTAARHNIKIVGLNQHVGSLFLDPTAYLEAMSWLLETATIFSELTIIDFGGGFGIPYHKYENEPRLDLAKTGKILTERLQNWMKITGYTGSFYIEPGRYISAESGLLLGTAYAVKNNGSIRFVGTDMGFSTLIRPAMYDSFHDIEVYPASNEPRKAMEQTIVGNICESGDIVAKARMLPEIKERDILGVLDAGAYGHAMSSNYNQRLRPAEVLITGSGEVKNIRRRDTINDLLAVFPK